MTIGHVRYINIRAWLRGFRVKIAKFSSFLCPSIPKRDLDTKKTTPNTEVWPESLGVMLEYWYIERGLLTSGFRSRALLPENRPVYRPRSIYQYSNTAPRLSGQNCNFFKFLLSLNSQKRLEDKENNTKYRSLTRKPRSHVRILIYRTWAIPKQNGNASRYSRVQGSANKYVAAMT